MVKGTPEHAVSASKEISQGSFDDDDCLEMVPVVRSMRQSSLVEKNDFEDERPSNEKLLLIAFFTFTIFTIFQTVAAFIAGSEAMLGDSGAMFVDALTYLFNLIAERRKSKFEEYYREPQHLRSEDPIYRSKLKKRTKRKMILRMELIPPVISVLTLLCVTGFVLHRSLTIIVLDEHRDRSEQGVPNLGLMLAFSCLNLVVDGVNMFCFANAKRLYGFATSPKHIVPGSTDNSVRSPHQHTPKHYAKIGVRSDSDMETDVDIDYCDDVMTCNECHEDLKPNRQTSTSGIEDFIDEPSEDLSSDKTMPSFNAEYRQPQPKGYHQSAYAEGENDNDEDVYEEANLNMCSAYTHVFADTLRSIAVIIAATVAELSGRITSEEADATAAVVVSFLILMSLFPLLSGMISTFGELRSIYAEEKDEHSSFPPNRC